MSSYQKLFENFLSTVFFKIVLELIFAFAMMPQKIYVMARQLVCQDLCQSYQTTVS